MIQDTESSKNENKKQIPEKTNASSENNVNTRVLRKGNKNGNEAGRAFQNE